jgi:hypothetical protein
VIEFYAVDISGEPECLEHEQLAWVTRDELLRHHLAPSDLQFARYISGQAENDA